MKRIAILILLLALPIMLISESEADPQGQPAGGVTVFGPDDPGGTGDIPMPVPAPPGDGTNVPLVPQDALGRLLRVHSQEALQNGVYVGSEFCIACHPAQHTWRDTKHAQALRRPMAQFSLVDGKGVVADFDRNGVDDFMQGLDFNQISSAFDPYKPNAPILSFAGGAYLISIGQLTLPVISTQGGTGDWKQRYLVRIPVAGLPGGLSAENYVSPVQYNEVTRQYVSYHPEQWWDSSGAPHFGPGVSVGTVASLGRSYSKKCIGCHTTGTRELGQTAGGEWLYKPFPAVLFDPDDPGYFDYDHDGFADIVNVGCEACHGPGSAHILGGGDASRIVNPEELSTEEANEVCGQCHSRVKSVPGGVHDWPYNDETGTPFIPGQGMPLADFFTDASGRWPDGVNSRQHHQQWLDFLESPKPGFRFHPVKCIECHAAHGGTNNKRLIRDFIVDDGLTIPTRNDNDSLCLACHAGFGPFSDLNKQTIVDYDANQTEIGVVVSAHANHPFGPGRSMGLARCSECHMPKIAKSAINFDIRSHTFEAIAPEKTLIYQDQGGMPNSCAASCHSEKVNSFGLRLDPDIGTWNQAFDRSTARILERFFGPGGLWWDTNDSDSATAAHLLMMAAPGDVVFDPEEHLED